MGRSTFRYAFCFIFDAEGRVLVVRRSPHMRARPDEWDLPGGKLESGEMHDEGLRREIREETGLSVENLELVVRKRGHRGGSWHEFSYYRANCSNSAKLVLGNEHTESAWLDPLLASLPISYPPHRLAYKELVGEASPTVE